MTGAFVEGCCKQIEESAKNFRIFVRAGAKTSFGQAGLRLMISLLSADEPRLAHYFSIHVITLGKTVLFHQPAATGC
jgi:hypothetical protein